ncbi:hypothetical protein pb186bvf_017149 [Paramecium bursaria]
MKNQQQMIPAPLTTPTSQRNGMFASSLKIAKKAILIIQESPIKSVEFSTNHSDREAIDVFSLEGSPAKKQQEPQSEDRAAGKMTAEDESHSLQNSPMRSYSKLPSMALQSNKLLAQKINTYNEDFNMIQQTQIPSGNNREQIDVEIQEEMECKFCKETDSLSNFIRPCLCGGSMRYVHQKCVQADIEANYMDINKRRFIKDLKCDICKQKYVIKTYKSYNLKEAIQHPEKYKRFVSFILGLIILLLLLIFLVSYIAITKDQLTIKVDILILLIVVCMVCLSLILVITFNLSEILINFEWHIMDRKAIRIFDSGQLVDIVTLNYMLEKARDRMTKIIPKIQN